MQLEVRPHSAAIKTLLAPLAQATHITRTMGQGMAWITTTTSHQPVIQAGIPVFTIPVGLLPHRGIDLLLPIATWDVVVHDAAVGTEDANVIEVIATMIKITKIANTVIKTARQYSLYLQRIAVSKNKKQQLLLYLYLMRFLIRHRWINLKRPTNL